MQGYMSNSTAVSGVGSSYAVAKKVTLDTVSPNMQAIGDTFFPDGCELSHLRLNLTALSSVTAVEVCIWADANCDEILVGPSQASTTVQPGLTTSTKGGCTVLLDDITPTFAEALRKSGQVFVTLKANSGGSFTVPVGGIEMHYALWGRRGS
jgi:hypothetical protein